MGTPFPHKSKHFYALVQMTLIDTDNLKSDIEKLNQSGFHLGSLKWCLECI